MHEQICRLCLQTTENYQPFGQGQSLKDILILNMNISNKPVKCMECTNNLELFLKLKSDCDYLKSKSELECCFCAKTSESEALSSINESKEYTFVLDKMKEHIPKLNLNTTEELLTCQTCLDELQDVFNFVKKCLDVEQQINKYTEINGTDDKGQIELRDVQQFLSKQMITCEIKPKCVDDLGERCDQFQDEHTMQTESEMKYEEKIENPEVFMKTEDIDIKSEQDDCNSYQEPFVSSTIVKIDNGAVDILEIPSQIKNKKRLNQLPHKNIAGMTMYVCELCPYETHKKYRFNQHELTHKSTSEVTMLKCELCSYQTKYRHCIKQHKLIHKSATELTMFKCELCSYQTKYRSYLKQHELTHKSTSEVTIFKCELCSYQSKHRSYVKKHELIHKSSSDIAMYKCELCSYETKYQSNIKQHKVTHKSSSEIAMFKCELCPFQTKYHHSIKKHKLTHKSTTEVEMFKCELCSFQTKHCDSMKQHKLKHKSTAEVTMFKCELCAFKSRHRSCIKQHELTHKTTSEVTMFKCELCSFETKHRTSLNRHNLTHESTSKLTLV